MCDKFAMKTYINKIQHYSIEKDNLHGEIHERYTDKPKYVEYDTENTKWLLYDIALENAKKEITKILENVNNYKEAREILIKMKEENTFIYTEWCVIYLNDEDHEVNWDVRWY